MSMRERGNQRTVVCCGILLLGVLMGLMPGQGWAREGIDPFVQNARLGRGVNIIGYDPIWRSQDRGRFKARHFRLIKEAGFSTVRINLHPFRHMDDTPDHRISPSWLKVLDWAVEQAHENELMVILDLHQFNAIGNDPGGNKSKFLAFWRQISRRYRDQSDRVLFEILNEPCRKLTPELWNQWLSQVLAMIRKTNPTRTVIIGPASWNSVNHLNELRLPENDHNLIVTVHYYSPMEFTHQGASWSSHQDKSGITSQGGAQDKAPITQAFDKAQAWSKKHRRPIFLGEFGAYDKAPMASRVRYTTAVARAAEQRGWSWAYWQFDSDFIVYDIDRESWVEPIRNALIPSAVKGAAYDWPHWRGPHKNGISSETNWSRQWPAQGPKVLWRASVGTGFSSMAVADGRVYTMGNTGRKGAKDSDQDQDIIYCFAADTGKTLWTHAYQSPVKSMGYEGGTSATPTIHQGKVYTISKIGQVFCLDAATGDVIWERDLVKEHKLKIATWGFAGSVLVLDDLLVLNAGTHGLALNKADGSLAWITGQEKAGYSTAVEYESQGKVCVTLFGRDTLAGVVAHTGEVLWEIPWKAMHDENIADPVMHDNKMLVSSFLGGRCALFDLAHDRVKEIWTHKDLLNWLSTSVLWKGHVYGMDAKTKALHCMDFHTGKLIWTQPGFGLGQLMMADGQLIALSDKGRLVIATASPKGYRELASVQVLQGKCWTVPVLANGRIYARNAAGDLVCLDVSTSVSVPR